MIGQVKQIMVGLLPSIQDYSKHSKENYENEMINFLSSFLMYCQSYESLEKF
jgi:uncharacterized short protein YbdD (DUF466 family)